MIIMTVIWLEVVFPWITGSFASKAVFKVNVVDCLEHDFGHMLIRYFFRWYKSLSCLSSVRKVRPSTYI